MGPISRTGGRVSTLERPLVQPIQRTSDPLNGQNSCVWFFGEHETETTRTIRASELGLIDRISTRKTGEPVVANSFTYLSRIEKDAVHDEPLAEAELRAQLVVRSPCLPMEVVDPTTEIDVDEETCHC